MLTQSVKNDIRATYAKIGQSTALVTSTPKYASLFRISLVLTQLRKTAITFYLTRGLIVNR
jgi:hypothetical protein